MKNIIRIILLLKNQLIEIWLRAHGHTGVRNQNSVVCRPLIVSCTPPELLMRRTLSSCSAQTP